MSYILEAPRGGGLAVQPELRQVWRPMGRSETPGSTKQNGHAVTGPFHGIGFGKGYALSEPNSSFQVSRKMGYSWGGQDSILGRANPLVRYMLHRRLGGKHKREGECV